jgi:threonine dehydrogenase-like Zn-dependent dehydrogenase
MMYRHEDYELATGWIASGKIITEPLLTRTFPFEAYHEAYKFIAQQADKSMKVIVEL